MSENGSLPIGWTLHRLGDITDINMGQSPPSESYNEQRTGLPFYQGKTDFGRNRPTVRVWCSAPAKTAHAGDILICVRAPVGDVNIADADCCIGRGLAAITASRCDPGFLFWLLQSQKPELDILSQGSTFEAINGSDLRSVVLGIPPLPEQRKIAEILGSVDDNIEKTQALIAKLQDLKKATMQELLTKGIGHTKFKDSPVGRIPEKWEWSVIGDLCFLGRGRVISAAEITEDPGIYPVYSSQSKDYGVFGYLSTYDFEGVYVTWTTDGAYAGAVFYRTGRFNCTNVCGTLKSKAGGLDMRFLASALSTRTRKHVSYVGNPKLMNNVMAEIEVPLPPHNEQARIADTLAAVDVPIACQHERLNKLHHLKKALMQDLLTGRVRVKV